MLNESKYSENDIMMLYCNKTILNLYYYNYILLYYYTMFVLQDNSILIKVRPLAN